MSEEGGWVERLVHREISAAVRAGIGRWSVGEVHPVLGGAIYEYCDHRLTLCVCEIGFSYVVNGTVLMWKYNDIDEIFPASLRELVGAGGPDGNVNIGIRAHGDLVKIGVPYKLYSILSPSLLRIIGKIRGEMR